ncbi:MAG: hypothetical protein GY679_01910 [Mycoplasma sp.]|nr:hypothetical protein [Mycoplasma sp.]
MTNTEAIKRLFHIMETELHGDGYELTVIIDDKRYLVSNLGVSARNEEVKIRVKKDAEKQYDSDEEHLYDYLNRRFHEQWKGYVCPEDLWYFLKNEIAIYDDIVNDKRLASSDYISDLIHKEIDYRIRNMKDSGEIKKDEILSMIREMMNEYDGKGE